MPEDHACMYQRSKTRDQTDTGSNWQQNTAMQLLSFPWALNNKASKGIHIIVVLEKKKHKVKVKTLLSESCLKAWYQRHNAYKM